MAENKNKLICIGTSTGGPRALQTLLPLFPKGFNVPILIVQHMPPMFTTSLANRLNTLSHLHVKEAEQGETIKGGTAYIAPGGRHMTVEQTSSSLLIKLDESEPYQGHRPSVNRLFHSLSEIPDYKKIVVILTGMGSDGTEGIKTLKSIDKERVVAIAEAEESCIVYGMPKSAIEANVIDQVVPLDRMAETILMHV